MPPSIMRFFDLVQIRLADCGEKLLSTVVRNLISGFPVMCRFACDYTGVG